MPQLNSQSQQQQVIQEIEQLKTQIQNSTVPKEIKERVDNMIKRLERMAQFGSYSTEFEIVSKYIDWTTSIPWNNFTQDRLELDVAKQMMDKNHYGMEKVKQMILDYLAVMKLRHQQIQQKQVASQITNSPQPNQGQPMSQQVNTSTQEEAQLKGSSAAAPILCFVGLQGVGKTTMAKSIAQALNREFVRIPLGALGDVGQLRGVPRTSLQADPGLIIKGLIRAKTRNPIILLDEIDKTSAQAGLRSDMMAFLLEILDPQQNSHFRDYYIDHPIDLSSVFFITTANTTGTISTALLDRLEVIRFTSYSDEEKIVIARKYLLPSILENLGLNENQVHFTEDVWSKIVRPLGFDAGVRQLERNITKICRHAARKIVDGTSQQVEINVENVREFLPVDVAVLE
jgi:ATP-dependent Lon protease